MKQKACYFGSFGLLYQRTDWELINTRHLFLTLLEVWSQRSGFQPGPLRALFTEGHRLLVSLHCKRSKNQPVHLSTWYTRKVIWSCYIFYHPYVIKSLAKLKIQGNYLTVVSMVFNGERLNGFHLRSEMRPRCLFSPFLFSIIKSLSHVLLFVTPRTVARRAPLSMEFSR